MPKYSFFIAGTDTDVGKTVISAGLLECANQQGLRTMGLKPVAAGCEMTDDGLRNDDALALIEHASVSLSYEQVNPVALTAAISPHIAAEQESRRLSADRLAGYCHGSMMTPYDFCIIEGAGGWRAPISQRDTMATLAKQLAKPVILVVGVRLGCLNHALLTAQAIISDGLPLAGWVANVLDPNMGALNENIESLKALLPAPCLGEVPFNVDITPNIAAEHLNINKLLDMTYY